MHGPIPMKVESCRAEMLRACLSPAQILRQGSFQATVVGLRTFGRRTHEDEWDEVRARASGVWFACRSIAQVVQGLSARSAPRGTCGNVRGVLANPAVVSSLKATAVASGGAGGAKSSLAGAKPATVV